MTGGGYTMTTEILEDKKWKVLPNGNLPGTGIAGQQGIYGLRLATVDNNVFSFGKMKKLCFFYLFMKPNF